MRIAVLMANTDESEFAQRHPKDGAKFQAMIHSVRPDWAVDVFAVKDGEFPAPDATFDGWIITGSPASVHDNDPWVAQLSALIVRLEAARQPLFGACFGHQAIAKALGGVVGDNPSGWVFGLTETHLDGAAIRLYAAHKEQVLQLPIGAVPRGGNAECPIGAFALGQHVLTTQYHPEMTHGFVTELTEAFAHYLPPQVVETARQSLTEGPADSAQIAAWIIGFFEQAKTA